MPTADLKESRLKYIEHGQGDPVVLVHGSLGDYRSWQPQIDALADKHRAISYSRRYHYPNQCTGNESDYSAVLHADDLAAFLTELELDSAHIVGNSYGAYTALFLAVRHPERVKSLALGEPPIFPLLEHHPEGSALRDAFLAEVWEPVGEILRQERTKAGVGYFVDGVVGDGAFEQFPPEVQELILDNACELKAETSSADYWTPFTCEDARGVTAPTLLLTGKQSLRMFQLIVDELDYCLPNSERVEIPKCTHELPADNPEAYNEIVLGFLAKHSS